MAEEKDIYFGAPKEHVEYAKKIVPKMGGMMALMAKAIYEKYGEEGIEVMAAEVKRAAVAKGEKFTKELGYTPEEVTVPIALSEIYAKSHGDLAAAGLDLRRQKLTDDESESHVHYCGLCEGWKTTWDKPWYLCYIFSTIHDIGFMEGVNPKLEWIGHAEDWIGTGKEPTEVQKGLAHYPAGHCKPGDDQENVCVMRLKLHK